MSDTYKVVINNCYGGFGLSEEATNDLYSKYPAMFDVYDGYNGVEKKYLKDSVNRHDKRLVEVVEKFGDKASGSCAELKIEEISTPAYRIGDYDGYETLCQPEGFYWCDASKD